jgi:pseudouridine synthase
LPKIVLLHKPRGVLVSRVSEGGAPTVFSLLPQPWASFHPVGRLDKDSEGLLLLCQDPKLAQRLMDPGVLAKTYLVTVRGLPKEETLEALRAGGLDLGGRKTRPAQVRVLGKAPRGGTRLEVILHEGMNRQIRRCFHRFGHRVRRLQRVAVGPVALGSLPPGHWRDLTPWEVENLLAAAGLAWPLPGASGVRQDLVKKRVRVLSGGQTGVDRAALDVALELGLPCGGYCPRGRKAEDGPLPNRYPLVELTSPAYGARTWANVRAAEATLVLTPGPLRGGTLLTVRACKALGKPFWVVDPRCLEKAEELGWRLGREGLVLLNVAGPRESQQPGVYAWAQAFLRRFFPAWLAAFVSHSPRGKLVRERHEEGES